MKNSFFHLPPPAGASGGQVWWFSRKLALWWLNVGSKQRFFCFWSLKVARPSSNPTLKLADFFSICPPFHDYSRYEKKLGVTVFVFSETEVENYRLLYVLQASPRVHYTKPLQRKILYLEIFSKTARAFLIHFSWKWERKKWVARFCSTNKTVFYRHWHSCQTSQIRRSQTIRFSSRPFKTIASNAQSVELWTLDQLDRDSLPVQ